MNCDCRKKFELKLLEKLQQESPAARDFKGKLDNYTMLIDDKNGLRISPFMNFVGSYTVFTGKGKAVTRKIKHPILFNYCPFCGKSVKPEVQDEQ